MEWFHWILNLDHHLGEALQSLGGWFYGMLFAIIFCETGLVITPFLPGDSLLFAVGAVTATHSDQVSIAWMFPILLVAAIAGDAVNYAIGYWIGPRVFRKDTGWLLNKHHLEKAQAFYDRYGGKAIFLARFLPILRTFAPFVAGIGKMQLTKFWFYNILGGFCWVALFLFAGYFFGSLPIVKKYFHYVILGIIVVSVLPILWEWKMSRHSPTQGKDAS